MPRHRSIERPPAGRSVQIEVDGVRHEATYAVDGPMVTIDSLLLGRRARRLGDDPPEIAAKQLLLELVHLNARRMGS